MGSLLAFDPSMTAFGWCHAYSAPMGVGTWNHGTIRAESLTDLSLELAQMMATLQPDLIAYEDPIQAIFMYGKKQLVHLPNGGAMFTPNADQIILWKIEGAIRALAAAASIPTLAVPVKTWRATVLKDGNLPKDKAKQRARQTCVHLGIDIRSVDEAEACCVAVHSLGTIEFRDALRRANQRMGLDEEVTRQ